MGKLKAMVVGFVCAATLTVGAVNIVSAEHPVAREALNKLAGLIDNTDLKDEKEVAQLTKDMNDWGELIDGEFQSAHLERVVDGDTIVVDIDGQDYKVRLIGVNTPESVASEEYLQKSGKENTAEGKAASEYTKEVLANTDVVFLQADVSDTDKYDRLLRYVWLELPDDQFDAYEIETKMLNAMLIEDNVAGVEIYQPDDLYADELYEISEEHGNTLTDYGERD